MPIFEFFCEPCDVTFDEIVAVGETPSCPKCKGVTAKAFTCTTNFIVPEWMSAKSDKARDRYKAWVNSDSTKAKLESGVYATGSDAFGTRNRWDASDYED